MFEKKKKWQKWQIIKMLQKFEIFTQMPLNKKKTVRMVYTKLNDINHD